MVIGCKDSDILIKLNISNIIAFHFDKNVNVLIKKVNEIVFDGL